VGGSTNVCVIHSWELFGTNGLSQNGSSYVGVHLLKKYTFVGVLVRVRMCVCMCMRACMRVCVCVCVHIHAQVLCL